MRAARMASPARTEAIARRMVGFGWSVTRQGVVMPPNLQLEGAVSKIRAKLHNTRIRP